MNMYGNFNGTTGHTAATDAAQANQMRAMTQTEDALAQSQAARLLRMREEQARMQPVDTTDAKLGGTSKLNLAPAPAPAPAEAAPAEEAPTPGLRLPDQKIVNRNLYNRPPKGRAARGGMTAEEAQIALDQASLAKPFLAFNDMLQFPMSRALNAVGHVGADLYNLGGRTVNALTGKPLIDANQQSPFQYGDTPYFDAARRREAQVAAARGLPRGAYQSPYPAQQQQAPAQQAAQQQAPAPGTVAQGTSQYDNIDSGYEDLIAKSAIANGLDPLAFKRLLGTESSFRPDIASERGESFGLGIAQIADVHGLSREAKLDPNQAIPFAAQLFAKYLKAAGGDYAEAMMKYKGASSAAGRAAMQGPISEVLLGKKAAATQAAATQAPATQAAATQAAATQAPATQEVTPEFVAAVDAQTQQTVSLTRQRILELARRAQYAVTYQERNDLQKQVDDLRYGNKEALLQNAAVKAGTGDEEALGQLALAAGVSWGQTPKGYVLAKLNEQGQYVSASKPMGATDFAKTLYHEASGAAKKERAAQAETNREIEKTRQQEYIKNQNAILLAIANGEVDIRKAIMDGKISKDTKAYLSPLDGQIAAITNSQGAFEVVRGGIDPDTGIMRPTRLVPLGQ